MARKVINITHSASQYDILSQTPENYNPDNYFLNQLQEKVNQDWNYRPNRALIEYESDWGRDKWAPIDIVFQTVKSEKGTDISDDYRNIVFKNILEDRFKIGHKFRFSPRYDINAAARDKNVWLAVNDNNVKMTASMVISRCNGVLGSIYKDEQGVSHYHYEPVIQGKDLSSTGLSYNEAAVAPQSQLVITAQYNAFTSRYKINQRFIIGARVEDPDRAGHFIDGSVYRITAINKYYGNSTYNPENIGLLKLYLELTENSPYDDWDAMIAYQQDSNIIMNTETKEPYPKEDEGEYKIVYASPVIIPEDLGSDEIIFVPQVIRDGETEGNEEYSKNLTVSISLENWPQSLSTSEQSKYIELQTYGGGSESFSFSLKRNRVYTYGDLVVSCSLPEDLSPTKEKIETSFKMVVRRK